MRPVRRHRRRTIRVSQRLARDPQKALAEYLRLRGGVGRNAPGRIRGDREARDGEEAAPAPISAASPGGAAAGVPGEVGMRQEKGPAHTRRAFVSACLIKN